jgi:methionyl-tRNA formyltransferase
MGTATFAVPSLRRLFEKGYAINGVITQPDKPSGRGQTLHASPLKELANELQLPVHQPSSLKTDETRQLMAALSPDLVIVVAYGKILPPWLLQVPRYGCINVHGSILPKYRGAAPVHWALANGESKTGVCTMLLDEGLDTGGVYLCDETEIEPEETVTQLYDRLAAMGAPLLERTVAGVTEGTLKAQSQDSEKATYAPILKKEDGFIDWRIPARKVHDRVRAFNPWPGTVTRFRGNVCKVLKARRGTGELSPSSPLSSATPGAIQLTRRSLNVVCGDGETLEILSIQPENKKAVSGADFANGARIQPGEKFEPMMDNERYG